MRRLKLIFLGTALAAAACGGNGSPPSSPPPGGGGDSLTGNERLGWNQSAADVAELGTFRYAAYVDGNRVELADVNCGSGGSGFQCSSRMPGMPPGQHRIELASYIITNGEVVESPRSAALQVTMAGATAPVDGDSAPARTIEQVTADGARLRLVPLPAAIQDPTAMAFAPDGSAFVAERAGTIRLLPAGDYGSAAGLAIEIADVVVPAPSTGGLLDLAIDPAFAETRFVYALYTAASSGGTAFTVARFREVGGRLGERVVLLADVAAAAVPAASIAFGPDRKLYVALDNGGAENGGAQAAYNGKLLRLNADGTTPADAAGRSPIYSAQYQSPRGFDWHPKSGALWIVDTVSGDTQELRLIGRDTPRHIVPSTRIVALPPQTGAAALAFYRGDALAALQGDLLVAAQEGRYLLRVRFDPRNPLRVMATESLFPDLGAPVTFVTVGPDGAVYLGTPAALLRMGPQ
jgi:aldose sugar dehydrogenase